MTRDDGWETINVRHTRMNGLRLISAREDRSIANVAERILRNAGVDELSDTELQKELRTVKKEDEGIPVVSRK